MLKKELSKKLKEERTWLKLLEMQNNNRKKKMLLKPEKIEHLLPNKLLMRLLSKWDSKEKSKLNKLLDLKLKRQQNH